MEFFSFYLSVFSFVTFLLSSFLFFSIQLIELVQQQFADHVAADDAQLAKNKIKKMQRLNAAKNREEMAGK